MPSTFFNSLTHTQLKNLFFLLQETEVLTRKKYSLTLSDSEELTTDEFYYILEELKNLHNINDIDLIEDLNSVKNNIIEFETDTFRVIQDTIYNEYDCSIISERGSEQEKLFDPSTASDEEYEDYEIIEMYLNKYF